MVVLLIQSINALIGCVSFSWPSSLPSLNTMASLKVYGRTIMLTGQGIITATGVVLVEELLFRSWLPEEIAADLGYHRGIIISGLAFSIFQRYLNCYFEKNFSMIFSSCLAFSFSLFMSIFWQDMLSLSLT